MNVVFYLVCAFLLIKQKPYPPQVNAFYSNLGVFHRSVQVCHESVLSLSALKLPFISLMLFHLQEQFFIGLGFGSFIGSLDCFSCME